MGEVKKSETSEKKFLPKIFFFGGGSEKIIFLWRKWKKVEVIFFYTNFLFDPLPLPKHYYFLWGKWKKSGSREVKFFLLPLPNDYYFFLVGEVKKSGSLEVKKIITIFLGRGSEKNSPKKLSQWKKNFHFLHLKIIFFVFF